MKQRIKPGEFLDFLTPEELIKHSEDHTQALLKAFGKNAAFRRVVVAGAVNGGAFTINIPVADGFVWDVRAASVAGPNNATKAAGIFINEADPLNFIASCNASTLAGLATPATIPAKTCIVHSGEQLVAQNITAWNPDNVAIMISVVEVPLSHMSDLLL